MGNGVVVDYSDYPFPVPVVRVIITDDWGRVLLLRRKILGHAGGRWCLPGGKVDRGQTVEQAAARELAEETQLEAVGLRFLFYQDRLPDATTEMHCINLYFVCETYGAVTLNSESCDYAWVDPEDLDQYDLAFGHDEALRRYWAAYPQAQA